jgi:predicted RNase H-like nuclease (RuvC/YqgF family)
MFDRTRKEPYCAECAERFKSEKRHLQSEIFRYQRDFLELRREAQSMQIELANALALLKLHHEAKKELAQ